MVEAFLKGTKNKIFARKIKKNIEGSFWGRPWIMFIFKQFDLRVAFDYNIFVMKNNTQNIQIKKYYLSHLLIIRNIEKYIILRRLMNR